MKPWEETWRVVKLPPPAEDEWEVESDHVSMLSMSDLSHTTLMSAAPELARVLLALESDTSDHCPMCGFRFGGRHEDFCPWDAALRKAGVR